MSRVVLSGRGRRRLATGHPWIYADDVTLEEAAPGDVVALEDGAGRALGWGLYSAGAKLRVRALAAGGPQPGRELWAERLGRAIARRQRLGLLEPDGACRLLAGDADGVPGLVIDRYTDVYVLQSGTQGSDRLRGTFVELLEQLAPVRPRAIVERSDASVRRLEGLEPRVEVLVGAVPEAIEVREDVLRFEVDVLGGHKTGHYLDQRENRRRAAREAAGGEVLDAFSYDGLFGVRAALAGARSVLCLDQSEVAGERVLRNAERNGVAGRVRFERVNAMRDLRHRVEARERYHLVVLDPPAFARSKKELPGAERGYRELALRGMRLAEDGGMVVSASCSHAVRQEMFLEWLAAAAADSGRRVVLEALQGAAPDHPALLTLPESSYLKCAFLRVE